MTGVCFSVFSVFLPFLFFVSFTTFFLEASFPETGQPPGPCMLWDTSVICLNMVIIITLLLFMIKNFGKSGN